MTAFTGHYGRYVLNNLIDSLDRPYDESRSETTGLMRLSNALAESCKDVPRDRIDQLRERGQDQGGIDQLVGELADSIIVDERFSAIDDLIRPSSQQRPAVRPRAQIPPV